MAQMDIRILAAEIEDLEEILHLQKIAYRSEAELHDDFSIPPLHQSIKEITEEYQNQLFLKTIKNDQLIASVRAYEKNETCFIGKLIVNPSNQNQGIGTRLLAEAEQQFRNVKRFELFTGFKSEKNLYVYKKSGYGEFKRSVVSEKLTLIYLEKPNKTS